MFCAIHCLGTPFLLIMAPALASTTLADEAFHKGLLFFVLPISVLALSKAYLHHRQMSVVLYGTIGLAMLLFAALWGHDLLGESGERIITLSGAAIVALAHLKNVRLCQKENCHHEK